MPDETYTAVATPAPADIPPPPTDSPTDLPGFALGAVVGRGGMGVVYRARDLLLDCEVAVKLLQARFAPDSPAARRFVEEARITAQLQHPGIPPVYHVGIAADGRPFLTMKLIKGHTLDVLIGQALPLDKLGVFQAMAQAVSYAHAHGVIHRDLKPANVMVGAFGEVQVMDWGLAKMLTAAAPPPDGDPSASSDDRSVVGTPRDSGSAFTEYGSAVGTPAYMPPEQAAGELEKVGRPSDVFGLGAVLCVLLTGRPPFGGANADAVRVAAVRGQTGPALDRLARCGADPDVIALAVRCLAADPADRPADAGAVAAVVADLRHAADDRARAAEVERGRAEVRAAEHAAHRRATVRWAAAAVGLLLCGVAGTGVGLVRADAARRDAEAAEHLARTGQADAEAARGEAQARATETAAALRFVQDRVFVAARPKGRPGGLGKEVTLRAAVQAAVPTLATDFADQPLTEARLRAALGDTLAQLGERAAAVESFERAVGLAAGPLGPDHPTVLTYRAGLADAFNEIGRYPDAHRAWEAVAAGRTRALGPDHPDTLRALHELALPLARMQRGPEALRAGQAALAAYRKALGPDHPDTLWCGRQLANNYHYFQQHEQAEALLRELLAAWERIADPAEPRAVLARVEMAKSLLAAGRPAEAVATAWRCWRDIVKRLDADDLMTLEAVFLSAALCGEIDPGAESLAALEASRQAHLRVHGPRHPITLQNADTGAKLLMQLGRFADALGVLSPQVAAQSEVLGADHADTLWGTYRQVVCLMKVGRSAEAVALIDGLVERTDRNPFTPRLGSSVLALKAGPLRAAGDAAGCRALAEQYERRLKPDRPSADSLYDSGRLWAVAAGCEADGGRPAAATAAADRAVGQLRKAVAAGWRDRAQLRTDADLAPLRGRADFQQLLAETP